MGESRNEGGLKWAVKGIWDGLTDEQKEKVKECKSMDELTELAAKFGVELTDEMLETVAGGSIIHLPNEPKESKASDRKQASEDASGC